MKKFIHGLSHQAINVFNMDRAKAFYMGVLGMELLYEDPMHVFLKVGEAEYFGILALLQKPQSGLEPVDPKLRQGSAYNHFGFRAKSSQEVYDFAEHLRNHFVQIIKGPYSRKDGASVYFVDPDGYTLEYLYLNDDPSVYQSEGTQ